MDTHELCGRSLWEPNEKELPCEVRQHFLLNPNRKRIFELIQSRPGINQNQLTETLNLNTGTIIYHLNLLKKSSHIITVAPFKTSKKHCFTRDNYHLWEAEPFRVLFGRATPWRVALYLVQNPGATTKEIAVHLEKSVPTIQRHIHRLQEACLIGHTRLDRTVVYHAQPRLVDWMKQVQGEVKL